VVSLAIEIFISDENLRERSVARVRDGLTGIKHCNAPYFVQSLAAALERNR
jgi:hypothetical protein